MELNQVGERTYYIKNATNIGIYRIDDEQVYLIDSGNDKDAGKKILKIIDENGWKVIGIINTHSNADHIGGNKVIQDRTSTKVFAKGIEKSFIENTILEPSFLYGGYPYKDLRNKFLMAKESSVQLVSDELIGCETFSLKGHFFDMMGIKTSDDVYFLGDSLFSEETINKYHIFYIYDIKEFLKNLDYLETLKGKLFIPSHVTPTDNIKKLIELNRNKILEIIENICIFCKNEICFEDLLKFLFDKYNLEMNSNQYVLVGSTIKSYLSYLYDDGKITYIFKNNKMFWKVV